MTKKQYVGITDTIYTEVYSDEKGILLESDKGNRSWWSKEMIQECLEPYTPPIRHSVWVTFLRGKVSRGCDTSVSTAYRSPDELKSYFKSYDVLHTCEVAYDSEGTEKAWVRQ